MKRSIILSVFVVILSCNTKTKIRHTENCCANSLEMYDKRAILEIFSKTLGSLLPDHNGPTKNGFYVNKDCHLIGAFVYDLTDTLNREESLHECIEFKESHVYHFAPMRKDISYSSLAVLSGGHVRIFKAVNCLKHGDKIEDVLKLVQELKIADDLTLKTIRNYRRYSAFIDGDEQSEFVCN